MNKAIFFDRDGVLNEDVGYLHEVEKFRWIDGAREAIKLCNEKNILAIVVTNQSGVARGYYTEDDVKKIHAFMQDDLKKIGAHIDAFYYCPHHPEGTVAKYKKFCDCRKPKPGMILKACRDFEINLRDSVLIGDSKRDLESAENAGVGKSIFFSGGNLLDALENFLMEE